MIKKTYRADIDGLRAFAFLLTFIYHLKYILMPGGYIGVDIFFVISGFLMTRKILDELDSSQFNFADYMEARLKRLFPAFVSVALISALVASIIFSKSNLMAFGKSLLTSSLAISNFSFWLEDDYFKSNAILKPLLHTWSLGVEEQFFLLWPLTLIIARKFFNQRYFKFLLFLGGLSFLGNIYFFQFIAHLIKPDQSETIFFLMPFRWFEFTLGAFAFKISQNEKLNDFKYHNLTFTLGFILIFYAGFYYNKQIIFPSYNALIPVIGTMLIIISSPFTSLSAIIRYKHIVSMGKITYSLYLVHWPLIVFSKYVIYKFSSINYFLIIVSTFVLAIINYIFIENKFRYLKVSGRKFYFGVFTLTSLLVVVGYSMWSSGWDWRINKSIVNFENHKGLERFGGTVKNDFGLISKAKSMHRIILFGDSHAAHYLEGLKTVIAQPQNISLYSSAGLSCFYFENLIKANNRKESKYTCNQRIMQGHSFMKDSTNPLVILVHNWSSQIRKSLLIDDKNNIIKENLAFEDILNEIKKLKGNFPHIKLLLIGNSPIFENDPYDMLTRPYTPYLNKIFFIKDDLSVWKPIIKKRRMEFNNKLAQASKETQLFNFINPYDYLCKDSLCKIVDENNYLIYYDDTHLSKKGSIYLIKKFKSKILENFN